MDKLQILGTGCPKCKMLIENVEKAVKEMGGEYEVVKVTDINDIISFGVMATPAFAINGDVQFMGISPVSKIISTVKNYHSNK